MWAGILDPAIRHEKHSAERGAAVRAIASKRHMLPSGRWVTFSERTILRKLDAYERHGMAGLSRPKRADAGAKRTILLARWDKAVPFDDATKHRIAGKLTAYLGGLVKAANRPLSRSCKGRASWPS